ncbi:DUF975 family protein [Bacillus suaedaesalsae]|uniref:DUF975 family protein n=1 Tax=Bacillus suaedaesalsae TaxID=2810349 RepID=A0ABS2DKH3_9BACI|nr:DUF975 family protein [Bacillus suaedaesalsae]MBM6618974.1 DUF975 family protein [Bacillus suaedaesalsae]
MINSEIKREARLSLSSNWGKAVGATLVALFLQTFIIYIYEFLLVGVLDVSETIFSIAHPLFTLVHTIVIVPLTFGVAWFYLQLVRKEETKVSHMFQTYKSGKLAVDSFMLQFLTGLLTMLWTLLLIIPGIIKSIAYSQTVYVYRDNPHINYSDAITESRRLMDGHKWDFVVLHLSFIGWFILSIFTLGIGMLWIMPYMQASKAAFYEELKREKGEFTINSPKIKSIEVNTTESI